MKILSVLGLSILAGWLYHRGGTNKGTLWRDIGCSIVNLISCLIVGLGTSFWTYFIVFGLHWGAYSTYWGLDEKKWGYWAHALGISLAILPIIYFTGHWLGFAIRVIVNTVLITVWSQFITIDWIEENGRGVIANSTLLLFLL